MHISDQFLKSYKSMKDWHKFRLRLFAEGIATGVVAGLVICFFRAILAVVEAIRHSFYLRAFVCPIYYHMIWITFVISLAVILTWLARKEPMAAGSGIPQVKGVLLGVMKLRWFSVLWVKIVGGVLAIGAGLSLGREGPSIQLGAVSAQGISRLLGRTKIEERYLMTSGASAGLAAAFNAPLAGVIFALEELHRNFSIMVLLPAMAAAFTATLLSRGIFGRESIFSFPNLQILPMEYYGVVIVVAIVVGLAGVVFNKGLLSVGKFYSLPIFKKQGNRILFALLVSIVLGYTLPEVLGGGAELINNLAQAPVSLQMLLLFLVMKFLFTLVSYGCGTPGGFFLPMLVIGALCGSVCSSILMSLGIISPMYGANIVVISMTALFASSVRAPITGTVLIMEMTGSYQQLLSLAIAAMVAFVVAELCYSKPIYEELLQRSLQASQPRKEVLNQRNLVELAVCDGSEVAHKLLKDINWPPRVLVIEIRRGEEQKTPNGDALIMPGDFIYVLAENAVAARLQEMVSEKTE